MGNIKALVYSFKGGIGKTSISTAIINSISSEMVLITNDQYSPLETYLKENRFIKLDRATLQLPKVKKGFDILFDMGGYGDGRILDIVKQVDKIVIPFTRGVAEIKSAIATIQEIKKYNNNIILVLNKAKKGQYEEMKTLFHEKLNYNYPLLEISESTAMSRVFELGKSVKDRVAEGGLAGHNFRKISKQIDALVLEITNKQNKVVNDNSIKKQENNDKKQG